MDRNEHRLSAVFAAMQQDLDIDSYNPSRVFAVRRQRERARKKASFVNPDLCVQAVNAFLDVNYSLPQFQVKLRDEVVVEASLFIRSALEQSNHSFNDANIQTVYDESHILANWRFGPGAHALGSESHAVEKWFSDWAVTMRARPLLERLIQSDPYLSFRRKVGLLSVSPCNGSRLATVPKNEETERVIMMEPIGNMCLQLAGGRVIETALSMIGYDIRSQADKNKNLARKASCDGQLATLDLKSASDMILPSLVKLLWPREWYEFFIQTRSPSTVLPDGKCVSLNMISTMGNGFTFPLMTMTLLALTYAVSRLRNQTGFLRLDNKRYGVFGDDIICPTALADELIVVLEEAGLTVNRDKSFLAGLFRESCGGDYVGGVDVTPFYIRSLSCSSGVYVAINQLLRWSVRHRVSFDRTLPLLLSFVDNRPLLVPEFCDDASGIRTTLAPPIYRKLSPKARSVSCVIAAWDLPLVLAGYVNGGDTTTYIPRQFKTRYRCHTVKSQRFVSPRSRDYLDDGDSLSVKLELIGLLGW